MLKIWYRGFLDITDTSLYVDDGLSFPIIDGSVTKYLKTVSSYRYKIFEVNYDCPFFYRFQTNDGYYSLKSFDPGVNNFQVETGVLYGLNKTTYHPDGPFTTSTILRINSFANYSETGIKLSDTETFATSGQSSKTIKNYSVSNGFMFQSDKYNGVHIINKINFITNVNSRTFEDDIDSYDITEASLNTDFYAIKLHLNLDDPEKRIVRFISNYNLYPDDTTVYETSNCTYDSASNIWTAYIPKSSFENNVRSTNFIGYNIIVNRKLNYSDEYIEPVRQIKIDIVDDYYADFIIPFDFHHSIWSKYISVYDNHTRTLKWSMGSYTENIPTDDYIINIYDVYKSTTIPISTHTTSVTELSLSDYEYYGNFKYEIVVPSNSKFILEDAASVSFSTYLGDATTIFNNNIPIANRYFLFRVSGVTESLRQANNLEKPTLTVTKNLPDSRTVTCSANPYAVGYWFGLSDDLTTAKAKTDAVYNGSNTSYTFTNIPYYNSNGEKSLYISAFAGMSSTDPNAAATSDVITYFTSSTKISTPIVTVNSKLTIDSYNISWKAITYADSYEVTVNNGLPVNVGNVLTYNVTGLIANTSNIILVRAIYANNDDYSSVYRTVTIAASSVPAYSTPVVTKSDIYDTDGSTIIGYKLTWPAVAYAKIDNVVYAQYGITDSWTYLNELEQTVTNTNIDYETTNSYSVYTTGDHAGRAANGSHDISVAVYDIDENDTSYNSAASNHITYEIMDLDASVVSYDNTSTTISYSDVPYADYYRLYCIPTGSNEGDADNVTANITSPYNYYSIIKDQMTETTSYGCYIRAFSYNNFYYGNGYKSNVFYFDYIKLNTPTNLSYDDATSTLTWIGDSNASGYTVSWKKSGDSVPATATTTATTYTFSDLSGFYTIHVTSNRDDSVTNAQPIYADSDESATLAIGTLSKPSNFVRGQTIVIGTTTSYANSDVLYWDNVGADNYIIYDNGTALPIQPITGQNDTTAYSTISWAIVAGDAISATPHVYTVQAYSTVDGVAYTSPMSDSVTVTITQATTPVISWVDETSVLYWATDSDEKYVVSITEAGTTSNVTVTSGTYTINKDTVGTYTLSVVAKTTLEDTFAHRNSETSNTVTYTVNQLATITDLTRTDETDFSWTAVSGAVSYLVYINDLTPISVSTNSYVHSAWDAGSYTVTVSAIGNADTATNPRPRNLTSASTSNAITFGKLATPVISISDNIISWDDILNASSYYVYNNGVYYDLTDESSYTIPTTTAYTYNITITAVNPDPDVITSETSNSVSYTVYKLAAPTNLTLSSANICSWNSSLNATTYNIYVNDVVIAQTANRSYDMSTVFSTSAGYMNIYVKSVSSAVNYIMSDASNFIIKTITKNKRYNIVIDGVNYDEIQLPFYIHRKVGTTLNTATMNIGYINQSTRFEPLTDAVIYMYERNAISRSYHMVIESDTVKEIYTATGSRYKHELTLIDNDILLQNIICPNFTVTQDIDLSDTIDIIDPEYPDGYTWIEEAVPKEVDGKSAEWHLEYGSNYTKYCSMSGLHSSITGKIYSSYDVGDIITLPIENGAIYYYAGYTYDFIKTSPSIYMPVNYYIRPHTDNLNKDPLYTETLINSNATYRTINTAVTYNVSASGTYDIIMEIPQVNMSYLVQNNVFSDSQTSIDTTNANYTYWPTAVPLMRDGDGNGVIARVVYSNITFVENNIATAVNRKTVSYALNKTLLSLNPADRKYKIDESISTYTKAYTCPDLTIDKGKYLYDVLELLGKEFNGVPRLEDDGTTITYDILTNSTEYSMYKNNFTDSDELEDSSQALDTYASGYISNISNMVPDKYYTIYPRPDSYMTPRADDIYSSVVTLTTMALPLDKDIYKIKKVICKLTIGSTEKTVDITDYVYEEALYSALTSSANGKGLHLVYTQGDNKIRGLGQLPEESETYATMGWKSDVYVIQRVVAAALYDESVYDSFDLANDAVSLYGSNVEDYQYQIWYFPYIETTTYMENSNKPELNNSIYKQFNQEDNVISDGRMGKAADVQLHRMGNATIQKTYVATDTTHIPLLGYPKTVGTDVYYIDEITYTFENDYIRSTVNYSKNYNKIDPRTGITSNYRQYELANTNIVNRIINFNNYCYISTEELSHDYIPYSTSTWSYILRNSFWLVGRPYEKMNTWYVKPMLDDDENRLSYTNINTGEKTYVGGIALPAAYSNMINSVQWSGIMLDNIAAGESAPYKTDTYDGNTSANAKYAQEDVRYIGDVTTSNTEQCPYINITLCSPTDTELYKTDDIGRYNNRTLPSVTWKNHPWYYTDMVYTSGNLHINKDSRETLGWNYQMHFVAYDDNIFIHTGLTNNLLTNYMEYDDSYTRRAPVWVGYIGDISDDDVMDGYIYTLASLTTSTVTVNVNGILHILPITGSFNNKRIYDGLALIWPDTKEIILEYRSSISGYESVRTPELYFNFNKTKIL